MKNIYATVLLLLTLTLIIPGCSSNWTKYLHEGETSKETFSETVNIKTKLDLGFVPVTINGKEYNFLFDTGAPLGLSKKLQEELNFKVVTQSNIVDSDRNRQQMQWAKVPAISISRATIKNALMDYGSNGHIALSGAAFDTLKARNIIGTPLLEKGTKNSGILGKPIEINREFLYSDSVFLDSFRLDQVMLQTGHKSTVGNKLFSRFIATIDWDNRQMHFAPIDEEPEPVKLTGFGLGISPEKDIYVQALVEPSNALLSGLQLNMKVTKVDELDFEAGDGYCDYVFYEFGDKIFVEAVDSTGKKAQYHFERSPIISK